MNLNRRKFFKVAGAAGAVALAPASKASASTARGVARRRAPRRAGGHDQVHRLPGLRSGLRRNQHPAGPGHAGRPGGVRQAAHDRHGTYTVVNRAAIAHARRGSSSASACTASSRRARRPAWCGRSTRRRPARWSTTRTAASAAATAWWRARSACPKYEYDTALPYVQKCTFCADRQAKGEAPACASVCPSGALTFGKRDELLEIARERLYAKGSPYVRHIYGEHEVGGTSWMYLTDIPFEKLGLPTDARHLRLLVAHPGVAGGGAVRPDPVAAAADGALHLHQAPRRGRRARRDPREEADHD